MSINIIERARLTGGTVNTPAIYEAVERVIVRRHPGRGTVLDVGCGRGELWAAIGSHFDHYVGADVLQHARLPANAEFHSINTETGRVPLDNACVEAVLSTETIEHVENPRAFFRELTRLAKPGGFVLVSTPNQLSLLSKMTLVLKNQFCMFQEGQGLYPAHITALVEMDLVRIARECGLIGIEIDFTHSGRIPGTARSWPKLPCFRGRAFSDNIIVSAFKPVP
jgi:SAM-dependent methyltransferase